ncbi:hypothetical protein AURDEDRAFT_160164 [Auricularia subglabra TFB-10046 SS5]|nr:hypothetical protein AURDEDRAFT_160164 [Auricularia subglabra TFB-10046 SS5]
MLVRLTDDDGAEMVSDAARAPPSRCPVPRGLTLRERVHYAAVLLREQARIDPDGSAGLQLCERISAAFVPHPEDQWDTGRTA